MALSPKRYLLYAKWVNIERAQERWSMHGPFSEEQVHSFIRNNSSQSRYNEGRDGFYIDDAIRIKGRDMEV